MKYTSEFRDGELGRKLLQAIASTIVPGHRYRLMEFCGGHTHALYRYGIMDVLPEAVQMIHGPGCPVCVLPIGRLENAIALAESRDVILCTYGDVLRVPAAKGKSLLKAKANGADIRMVYSPSDAVRIAHEHPQHEVVFFAVGFETTTPPTAMALLQAQRMRLENFSVYCNHVLTPPAMRALLEKDDSVIDGFIGPGHVSTIIGSEAYAFVPRDHGKPVVVSGFEPLDLLQSVHMLVCQINQGHCVVENQFTRAVYKGGNRKALQLLEQVFEVRENFEWRGLGFIPHSALRLRKSYSRYDAEIRYGMQGIVASDHKACECGAVLCGHRKPQDCKVFATVCTPENPLGSCMVSSEGACAAYYTYGRHQGRKAS